MIGWGIADGRGRFARRPGAGRLALLAGILALAPVSPGGAVDFGSGEFQGSFDTTLSHGLSWRIEDRDAALTADANGNDGDLNYDRGIVSNTSKITSDLELNYRNFGAFVRGTGFLDFENENGMRERTPLSEEAKDRVGRDLSLLDAYVTGDFEAGEAPVNVRLGKHVLNWGESTFIQNGINAINPFDVGKLRLPGSELREALVAVPLVSASAEPTPELSVEGFYQLDWEETEIDPVGSYFSVTDYVGPGARRAVIPVSPGVTDEGLSPRSMIGIEPLIPAINADLMALGGQPDTDPEFLNVRRGPDRPPGDSGQWGAAVRYLAEDLNDTEFGFYFMNYHSRLPYVGATGGTRAGLQSGLGAAGAVTAPASQTVTAITGEVRSLVTAAVRPQIEAGVRAALPAGTPEATIMAEVDRRLMLPETMGQIDALVAQQAGAIAQQAGSVASALAIDRYAKTASYHVEYPEDIPLVGASFNTVLGTSGWALQGEYSHRFDVPLQRAERSLFAEGLAPMLRLLDPSRPDYLDPDSSAGRAFLANYTPPSIQGYVERNVSQIQATATKVFAPMLGADSGAFVTEAALLRVHGMPGSETPLESPAGGVGDDPNDADATAWGYRLAGRLDYLNAVGAVNMFPYFQFQHDVSGNSPSPIGPFVEGRTAVTLGVRADYLSRWEANLNVTVYGGEANELHDRDFVSLTVRYSF